MSARTDRRPVPRRGHMKDQQLLLFEIRQQIQHRLLAMISSYLMKYL